MRSAVLLLALCSLTTMPGCAGKPSADDSQGSADDSQGSADDTGDTSGTTAGFDFVGGPSDAAGNAVALPGDVDGDGVPEVVIAAYYGNRVCVFSGAALVAGERRRTLDSAELCWTGASAYDFSGYDVNSAGDGDGDGRADVIVGAIGDATNGSNAGRVWILSGGDLSGTSEVPFADAASGSLIGEFGSDYAGVAVLGGADLTGDGALDYLVGASGNDAGGAGGGKAYLVPGPVVGEVELSSVDVQFLGLPAGSAPPGPPPPPHGGYGGGDAVGNAVAMPGDLDGDGVVDIVLGASGADSAGPSTGAVVVYYGPVSDGQHDITGADLTWFGPAQYSYAGSPVHAPGDVDGDGFADLLISADGVNDGTVYLVHGGLRGGANESRELDNEPTRWQGEAADDQAGFAVTSGDVDGDGIVDLVCGAPANDRGGDGAGALYTSYGPWTLGTHALADADVIEVGEQVADAFARALASGSDVDGDGADDVLVGAIYSDDGGAFSGKAYLYSDSARSAREHE